MMRFNLWTALSDIFYILRFRFKLILKDQVTLLVLGVSVVLFAIMIRSLAVSAEDLSSLPIGIVDYDNSDSSMDLISGLKNVETLRIVCGSENELHKLLLDEMITSVFVIEKGYEEHLRSGNLKKMISMFYKEGNKSASILADIVAGEIMYPVCLYKSFRYYEQLPAVGEMLSLEQYGKYMEKYAASSDDFNFAFNIIYKNPVNTQTPEKPLSNSVLYNQLVFGILGIMIAFIAMFIFSQVVTEKENRLEIRLKISSFHILKRDAGNLCALLIWEGLLSLLFAGLIINQINSPDVKLWLSVYLLILLNSIVLGAVMLLVAKLIKRMLPYQIFGSAFILFTGGLGFYNMLAGFYQGFINDMVKIIPNSWFIKGFTDIIVYGSEGGYLKEGHRILLIMAIVVTSLVIVIDLVQELHFINTRKRL